MAQLPEPANRQGLPTRLGCGEERIASVEGRPSLFSQGRANGRESLHRQDGWVQHSVMAFHVLLGLGYFIVTGVTLHFAFVLIGLTHSHYKIVSTPSTDVSSIVEGSFWLYVPMNEAVYQYTKFVASAAGSIFVTTLTIAVSVVWGERVLTNFLNALDSMRTLDSVTSFVILMGLVVVPNLVNFGRDGMMVEWERSEFLMERQCQVATAAGMTRCTAVGDDGREESYLLLHPESNKYDSALLVPKEMTLEQWASLVHQWFKDCWMGVGPCPGEERIYVTRNHSKCAGEHNDMDSIDAMSRYKLATALSESGVRNMWANFSQATLFPEKVLGGHVNAPLEYVRDVRYSSESQVVRTSVSSQVGFKLVSMKFGGLLLSECPITTQNLIAVYEPTLRLVGEHGSRRAWKGASSVAFSALGELLDVTCDSTVVDESGKMTDFGPECDGAYRIEINDTVRSTLAEGRPKQVLTSLLQGDRILPVYKKHGVQVELGVIVSVVVAFALGILIILLPLPFRMGCVPVAKRMQRSPAQESSVSLTRPYESNFGIVNPEGPRTEISAVALFAAHNESIVVDESLSPKGLRTKQSRSEQNSVNYTLESSLRSKVSGTKLDTIQEATTPTANTRSVILTESRNCVAEVGGARAGEKVKDAPVEITTAVSHQLAAVELQITKLIPGGLPSDLMIHSAKDVLLSKPDTITRSSTTDSDNQAEKDVTEDFIGHEAQIGASHSDRQKKPSGSSFDGDEAEASASEAENLQIPPEMQVPLDLQEAEDQDDSLTLYSPGRVTPSVTEIDIPSVVSYQMPEPSVPELFSRSENPISSSHEASVIDSMSERSPSAKSALGRKLAQTLKEEMWYQDS